jgi:hypothetical protein
MTCVELYIHELDEDLLFGFSLPSILVRSTKGSRNQAQERIENLHVLQHAKRHCMNRTINEDFAEFLSCNLIRSPKLDRPKKKRLILKQKCFKEDSYVRRMFPAADLRFFQVLYLDELRLSIRSYSHGKTSDDSNILFRTNAIEKFGRIRSIVTVDDQQSILFVAYHPDALPLICPIDAFSHFECNAIQVSSSSNWSYTLVDIDDFIEKTVFFENPDRHSCFFCFTNLTHSS